jgi:hypothetical protein
VDRGRPARDIDDRRFDPPPVRPIADGVDGDRRKDQMTPLDTLRTLRLAYPTPMRTDQLGDLLNAVAWIHRAEGYGVLKKPTGSRCPQPQTGTWISRDILCASVSTAAICCCSMRCAMRKARASRSG